MSERSEPPRAIVPLKPAPRQGNVIRFDSGEEDDIRSGESKALKMWFIAGLYGEVCSFSLDLGPRFWQGILDEIHRDFVGNDF